MTSRTEVPLDSPGHLAAIVALVVAVAAILGAVVSTRPRAGRQPEAPVVRVSAEAPAPAVTPTAPTLIDAIPWGRIERIETADGEPWPLPDPPETPILLQLPAGDWRVVLSNPSFAGEKICAFSLAAAERHDCLVEFERLSVDQYFREAGWWR